MALRTRTAALVLIETKPVRFQRAVAFQYNPDRLQRTISAAEAGGEQGERAGEPLRLVGPPRETIRLEAELDARDTSGREADVAKVAEHGVRHQIAALEAMLYPARRRLERNHRLARRGALEIVAMETPLTLLVWSRNRVVPVKVTELSVTEEAFDVELRPAQARVELSLRVLSVSDLGFDHRGADVFLRHHEMLEQLADLGSISTLGPLGLTVEELS
ncbi:MAG: hypothetical protein K0V04_28700 [Deltaproteobacteria bacterium]|nr:hypothetical protein [Deltaproteobacteria bacterium]